MITAENLTDEEIRALRDGDRAREPVDVGDRVISVRELCERALRFWGADPRQRRRDARARIAAILNARSTEVAS